MAGEGNKRKQLLLQELTGGPKTLEYLVEKFGVKESSIKHDIVNLKKQGLQSWTSRIGGICAGARIE